MNFSYTIKHQHAIALLCEHILFFVSTEIASHHEQDLHCALKAELVEMQATHAAVEQGASSSI